MSVPVVMTYEETHHKLQKGMGARKFNDGLTKTIATG